MARKGVKPDKPYSSLLEQGLHKDGPMSRHYYEPDTFKYIIEKTYKPDLVHADNENIWFEIKGRFRSQEEAAKYLWIRDCFPEKTLRFIVDNPNVKAYPRVKITISQWLDKWGFEWCTAKDIPDEWK